MKIYASNWAKFSSPPNPKKRLRPGAQIKDWDQDWEFREDRNLGAMICLMGFYPLNVVFFNQAVEALVFWD